MAMREEKIIVLGKLARQLEAKATVEERPEWKRELRRDADAIRWAIAELSPPERAHIGG